VVWSGDFLISYFAAQLAVSAAIELNVASSTLPMGIAILLPGRINRLEVSMGIVATFAQNLCLTVSAHKGLYSPLKVGIRKIDFSEFDFPKFDFLAFVLCEYRHAARTAQAATDAYY